MSQLKPRLPARAALAACLACLLLVTLVACGSPKEPPASVGTSAQRVPTPEARATLNSATSSAPSVPELEASSACMLDTREVEQIFASLAADFGAPEPNLGATSPECYYPTIGTDVAAYGVRIRVIPYDATEDYGFGVDIHGGATDYWRAPNAATGAQNACASADWLGQGTYERICEDLAGTPVVIPPNRYEAILFPEGNYFYVVLIEAGGGTEDAVAPLRAAAEILASRSPLK